EKTVAVEVGRPVVVESRKVRVRGRITAEANLTEATRDKDVLGGFRAGTSKSVDITEELTLTPGKREVKFTARPKDGPEARVTLADGENRFRVRLTNTWGSAAFSDDLILRYVRPPHDIAFEKPTLGTKPLADLLATVKTPTDLLPESIAATLNGRSIQPAEIA